MPSSKKPKKPYSRRHQNQNHKHNHNHKRDRSQDTITPTSQNKPTTSTLRIPLPAPLATIEHILQQIRFHGLNARTFTLAQQRFQLTGATTENIFTFLHLTGRLKHLPETPLVAPWSARSYLSSCPHDIYHDIVEPPLDDALKFVRPRLPPVTRKGRKYESLAVEMADAEFPAIEACEEEVPVVFERKAGVVTDDEDFANVAWCGRKCPHRKAMQGMYPRVTPLSGPIMKIREIRMRAEEAKEAREKARERSATMKSRRTMMSKFENGEIESPASFADWSEVSPMLAPGSGVFSGFSSSSRGSGGSMETRVSRSRDDIHEKYDPAATPKKPRRGPPPVPTLERKPTPGRRSRGVPPAPSLDTLPSRSRRGSVIPPMPSPDLMASITARQSRPPSSGFRLSRISPIAEDPSAIPPPVPRLDWTPSTSPHQFRIPPETITIDSLAYIPRRTTSMQPQPNVLHLYQDGEVPQTPQLPPTPISQMPTPDSQVSPTPIPETPPTPITPKPRAQTVSLPGAWPKTQSQDQDRPETPPQDESDDFQDWSPLRVRRQRHATLFSPLPLRQQMREMGLRIDWDDGDGEDEDDVETPKASTCNVRGL